MSDQADALTYALSQRSIRDASTFRWGLDTAEEEGLTADKLREAKRRLTATELAAVEQPSLFDAVRMQWDDARRCAYRVAFDRQILAALAPKTQTIVMEAGHTDAEVFKMLTKKDEVMNIVKKEKVEKFNTIGVRFSESPGKEFTYKVRIGAKPYLGQELVADTARGQAVVFVTRIDKVPVATTFSLKYIDRKAVAL